jgi:hypothetical protein
VQGACAKVNPQALLVTVAGLEGHVLRLVLCAWIPREPRSASNLGGRPSSGRSRSGFGWAGSCGGAPGRCGQCWPVASWRAISSISFCSPRIGRTMTVKLTSFTSPPQRKMSTPWT